MGQKVNPHGLRVGINKDWSSKWYADSKNFSDYLVEDHKIREYVKKVIWASGKKGIGLSELSNLVHGKYSSFSVKDFGYSQFSKFVQGIGGIETFEDGHNRKKVRKQD